MNNYALTKGNHLPLAVSEAPRVTQAPKKYQSYNPDFKTDEEKKEEVCIHAILTTQ